MNDPGGSKWRKWDLHVHTPSSLVNEYRSWEEFLQDLENLPPEYSTLGINDYLFVDGYERLLEEKKQGRIPNIDLLLPVIELRLAAFGGTESKLRRVNLHVIFSEALDPATIRAQFINALAPSYALAPPYDQAISWNAVVTPESLEELGKKIKESVPDEELHNYESDLKEGFNNITFSLDEVQKILRRPQFLNKTRIAVGKTEWAAIKWNDQSIADKKTIVNSADLLFIAAESCEAWSEAREGLRAAGVNHRLFDCSDAHRHADSPDKDRIGNSFCWVNADPSFEGLCHAIHEFEHRVYVGDQPPKLVEMSSNPSLFIDRIAIKKRGDATIAGTWFDCDLPINPGFTAIIGNKGKGKSALADTVGLLAASPNQASFSFLNDRKFKAPRDNKAKGFDATLTWGSGEVATRNLADLILADEIPRARYLPQSLLEQLCNEIPSAAEGRFEKELGSVIFSHVSVPDRLGQLAIDDLIAVLTGPVERRLTLLRGELNDLNSQVVKTEAAIAPENLNRIKNELVLQEQELARLDDAKPEEVAAPEETNDAATEEILKEIAGVETRIQELESLIRDASQDAGRAALEEAAADRILKELENLEHQFEQFVTTSQTDFDLIGVPIDSVVRLEITREPVLDSAAKSKALKESAALATEVQTPGSLAHQLNDLTAHKTGLLDKLDEPKRRYQAYLSQVAEWSKRRTAIIGDPNAAGSITALQAAIANQEALPSVLDDLRTKRLGKVVEIHEQQVSLVGTYRTLYAPVQAFIARHPLAADHFDLQFDVSLTSSGLSERLLDNMINRGVTGSFSGIEEGERLLDEMLRSTDFDDVESVKTFVSRLDTALHEDVRPSQSNAATNPNQQVRRNVALESVYDLIFGLEYLRPRYLLQSKGKPIAQLSPGEKGTLLLMFYLLVDNDTSPIVMDQPEENLDNQTVHDLLVPAIKDARQRRQVILVTHSPNLAVVGDADQIICADFDKEEFSYQSGSIENPTINKLVLDILEGTELAFADRGEKYQTVSPWRRREGP